MKKDDPLILLGKAIQKYREYLEDPEASAITVTMRASTATELVHLLERMEPVEPGLDIDTWVCRGCGHRLEHQEMLGDNVLINEQYNYCPGCGRAVLWNAEGAADGGGQEGGAGPEG